MDRPGVFDLLGSKVAQWVIRQDLRQDQQAVQRCPQLVRYMSEEFRLVLRRRSVVLCLLECSDVHMGSTQMQRLCRGIAGQRPASQDRAIGSIPMAQPVLRRAFGVASLEKHLHPLSMSSQI